MKKYYFALAVISIMVLASSCGKVPQAELDQTRAAIDSAKTAGAEQYLPTEYLALQDTMNAVVEKIEAEKSKMIRNFGDLKSELLGVSEMARTLRVNTETRISEVKEEIQSLLSATQALQEENKNLLSQAPKGKEGTAALEAIGNDIGLVESALTEAGELFSAGNFMASHDKVKAANEKAGAIHAELSEVIAKYQSSRRR